MIRGLAWLTTLVAIGFAGLWGRELLVVQSAPALPVTDVARSLSQSAADRSASDTTSDTIAQRWPALFGEIQPPAPPAAELEPELLAAEPQPPAPPLGELSYRLNGIVRAGDATWAMVSHPTGQRILQVGDTLKEGLEVVRIDSRGVWVDTGRGEPELLAFPTAPP